MICFLHPVKMEKATHPTDDMPSLLFYLIPKWQSEVMCEIHTVDNKVSRCSGVWGAAVCLDHTEGLTSACDKTTAIWSHT